jgi:TFIIF-interacting CTD phosphatase-like protein
MTELILLDLTGVVCQEVKTKDVKGATKLGNRYISFRPHLEEFLRFCYSHYKVGFFTSTTKKNAYPVIEKMLSKEQLESTEIIWYRDNVRYDPDHKTGFNTIKVLKDLYDNPEYNKNRYWSEKNVLMIDDSPEKMRFNNPKNYIVVRPYNPEESDNVLQDLMYEIPIKIKDL